VDVIMPEDEDELTTRIVEPHPHWGIAWLLLVTLSAASVAVLVWIGGGW
jgi:hypothetical protein